MGDASEGGKISDHRTKALHIRRKELEIKNLEYQSAIALLRADEMEVEILRQREQVEVNAERIALIGKDIATMKGGSNDG